LQGDDSSLESDNFDWNTDDELEIESFNSLSSTIPSRQTITAASVEVSFYIPFSFWKLSVWQYEQFNIMKLADQFPES